MYARKGLCDNALYAEIQRNKSRVLSRRALTVVAAADDDSLTCLLAVLGKVLIALLEAEVRQERYVRAVGENFAPAGMMWSVGCCRRP